MTIKLELNSPDEKVRNQLHTVARALIKSRKIVMVTGAGISCSAGIPDFRSKDGLYNMVKEKYPNTVVKGKDLFDVILFSSEASTAVFFTFMSALRKCILAAHSTPTHGFIKCLKERGKLLRCYTQNIDGLEKKEGLVIGEEVIQLHGDIHSLRCTACSSNFDWTEERVMELDNGEAPICPKCSEVQEKRTLAGRRNTGVGWLRPSIVLYGEDHSEGELIGRFTSKDLRAKPDFLIISGTSLKVFGIRKVVKEMAKSVKEKGGLVLFINMTKLSNQSMWDDVIDYYIEGESDKWVNDLKLHVPDFFLNQTKINATNVKKNVKNTNKSAVMQMDEKLNADPAIFNIPSPPSTPRKRKLPVDGASPCTPSKRKNLQPSTPSTPRVLRTPRTKRIQQGNLSLDVMLHSDNREPLSLISVNRRTSPRRLKSVSPM